MTFRYMVITTMPPLSFLAMGLTDFHPPYWVGLIGIACVFGLFAASVDLAWGYGGVLNLGSALYFGLGSYFTAYGLKVGWGFWTSLLLALVVSGAISLIVGAAAFRLRASFVQFGLIGLVLSLTAEQLAVDWYDVTGGSNGISIVNAPSVGFFFTVGITVLFLMILLRSIVRSHFGKILICVRDDPFRAESLGYSPVAVKLLVSVLASVISCIAGALYVPLNGIAHPGLFGVVPNMLVLVWVAVGGQGSIWGPFLCAFALKIIEFQLGSEFEEFYLLILGIVFIASVLFWPEGAAGKIRIGLRSGIRR